MSARLEAPAQYGFWLATSTDYAYGSKALCDSRKAALQCLQLQTCTKQAVTLAHMATFSSKENEQLTSGEQVAPRPNVSLASCVTFSQPVVY